MYTKINKQINRSVIPISWYNIGHINYDKWEGIEAWVVNMNGSTNKRGDSEYN